MEYGTVHTFKILWHCPHQDLTTTKCNCINHSWRVLLFKVATRVATFYLFQGLVQELTQPILPNILELVKYETTH